MEKSIFSKYLLKILIHIIKIINNTDTYYKMLISFTKLLTSIPRIQPVSRYKFHVFEEDEKNWLEGSERPIFTTVAKPVPSSALNRVWNATSLGAGMLSGAIGNGLRSGFKGNFADWVL